MDWHRSSVFYIYFIIIFLTSLTLAKVSISSGVTVTSQDSIASIACNSMNDTTGELTDHSGCFWFTPDRQQCRQTAPCLDNDDKPTIQVMENSTSCEIVIENVKPSNNGTWTCRLVTENSLLAHNSEDATTRLYYVQETWPELKSISEDIVLEGLDSDLPQTTSYNCSLTNPSPFTR